MIDRPCRFAGGRRRAAARVALLVLAAAGLAAGRAAAAPPALLPAGTPYDPAVPTPAQVLGWEVGTRHARPDQIVAVARRLAAASDRVQLEVQGETFEGRPQVLLVVSSPANLARIDEIRAAHRALSEPPYPDDAALAAMPVVVWLGYSIHGDEASGANAAMLVAYHLAAGRGPEVEALLEHAVVLIDPALNPDGLARFAGWVESHRGEVPVADPDHREHAQGWPSGRTNHYWFDLNRDWLLLQQPESRARVATFQRWRPNLLGDFHEMGSDSTYFFQPGVPSRQNPLTPALNLALTRAIARFHAAAFDRAGRLYYTEENYDDFYYGKGSTYPDVQGAVGVLFEQASARGLVRATENGRLTFADAVGGHVLTSLSMLAAAAAERPALLAYQRDAYRDARAAAAAGPRAGWVVGDGGDPARAAELLRLLAAHGIEARPLGRPVELGGHRFVPGAAWVVPADQRQTRLAEALFERRTTFADETFYDVSAWTLPLAFGLPAAELPRAALVPGLVGEAAGAPAAAAGRLPAAASPYAWAFEWRELGAPRALERLLAAGVSARVATRPFTAATDGGRHAFAAGAIVVPAAGQEVAPPALAELLATAAAEDGVDVWALASGLTEEGADLGSPSLRPLTAPHPLLVVGRGVAPSEAGEVWYVLDHRVGVPVALVDKDRLGRVDLRPYTHVVMVGGAGDDLPEGVGEALRRWLHGGGTLIATETAAEWAAETLLATDAEPAGAPAPVSPAAPGGTAESAPPAQAAYADYEHQRAVDEISGAIFQVRLDLTHPLAFGIRDPSLPVFRDRARPLAPSPDPYENVALYTERPLLAGYASARNTAALAGSAAVVAGRVGRGTLVRFADDPVFRAYWRGTEKLLVNALFFGPVLKATPASGAGRGDD